MNTPLWFKWMTSQFKDIQPINFSYPAYSTPSGTIVSCCLSDLEGLRKAVNEKDTLPRPVVPVMMSDCPVPPDLPKFKWLLSDPDGFWVYVGSERIGAANAEYMADYVPSNIKGELTFPDCTECQFSVNPCKKHVFGE